MWISMFHSLSWQRVELFEGGEGEREESEREGEGEREGEREESEREGETSSPPTSCKGICWCSFPFFIVF